MRKSIVVAVLALVVTGCASTPVAGTCVLGDPAGRELLVQESAGDPVDTLIARSIDEGRDWQCPVPGLAATTLGAL